MWASVHGVKDVHCQQYHVPLFCGVGAVMVCLKDIYRVQKDVGGSIPSLNQ